MLVRHRTYPTRTQPSPTFDRSFDRAFEQLTSSFFDTRRSGGPVIDGSWADDEYVLTVDLPGVPAEAVAVEVNGATLSLGASTDSLEWQRSVRLGGRLDPDKVSARHVDGRLTVRIGAVDVPAARSIEIDTTSTGTIGTGTAGADTADVAIETTSTETDPAVDGDQSTETTDTE